ncbi:hypothetical protein M885DRAFT_538270 [Pelagophyceae sp. CCMP2097]|nr:hypothetical protein M885DRAFT_538270 [Pelagophyceae sp. CCMP2097]
MFREDKVAERPGRARPRTGATPRGGDDRPLAVRQQEAARQEAECRTANAEAKDSKRRQRERDVAAPEMEWWERQEARGPREVSPLRDGDSGSRAEAHRAPPEPRGRGAARKDDDDGCARPGTPPPRDDSRDQQNDSQDRRQNDDSRDHRLSPAEAPRAEAPRSRGEAPRSRGESPRARGGESPPRSRSGVASEGHRVGPEGRSQGQREQLRRHHAAMVQSDLETRQRFKEAERETDRREDDRVAHEATKPWIGDNAQPAPRAYGRRPQDHDAAQRPATAAAAPHRDAYGLRPTTAAAPRALETRASTTRLERATTRSASPRDDEDEAPRQASAPRRSALAAPEAKEPSVARHLSAALDSALEENDDVRHQLAQALRTIEAYRKRFGPLPD